MNPPSLKRLTQDLIDSVAQDAQASPRLRKNYNFHDLNERVQRFLNVLQPGTYVRPHRHLRDRDVNGFEFFLALQGKLGLLVMNEQGEIVDQECIIAQGSVQGVELAEGFFHTLVVLEPNTVILELKEGPYNPVTDKEFLSMFPEEGTSESKTLIQTWESRFQ